MSVGDDQLAPWVPPKMCPECGHNSGKDGICGTCKPFGKECFYCMRERNPVVEPTPDPLPPPPEMSTTFTPPIASGEYEQFGARASGQIADGAKSPLDVFGVVGNVYTNHQAVSGNGILIACDCTDRYLLARVSCNEGNRAYYDRLAQHLRGAAMQFIERERQAGS